MSGPPKTIKTTKASSSKGEETPLPDHPQETSTRLVEGVDFVFDHQGRMIFTADYLKKRGECCGSGCRNCPF